MGAETPVLRIPQQMEPPHLEQQLELRQRQLQEIAGTFRVSNIVFLTKPILLALVDSHSPKEVARHLGASPLLLFVLLSSSTSLQGHDLFSALKPRK